MASGTRRIRRSVAAGAVVENILLGTPLEYPGRRSRVDIFGTVVAQGTGGDEAQIDVQFGTDSVAESIVMPVEAVAGQGPTIPENQLCSDGLAASDRLVIRLRNAHSGALIFTIQVRVMPA
jgi:hypothetical protein